MTKPLKISPDLALPTDAVTSTIIVYGGKGMGKTNLASVLVEEFTAARQRFAVIDPMGVWWGLRWDVGGRGPGIKLLILGGIRGDLPIDPTSGELVADLVVDDDANVIVDVSRWPDGRMWSISERVRFVRDYAKRIYQRQGEKRRPINQVIDEAARFAPQMIRHGELEVAACMGAVAVLVEEGRNVGVGVTLVTQRSARLNKDVAELADCMIAFRTVGPNSMGAVLDWLGEHVEKSRLKELGEKLRSLPRGSALVVSPGWLEFEGVAAMRKRQTFDSSATPETGKELRVYGPGAAIDVEKYRARWVEVSERWKANDPKALKARIAELEKQLAAKVPQGATAATTAAGKTVEKFVLKDGQLDRVEKMLAAAAGLIPLLDTATKDLGDRLNQHVDRAVAIGMKLEVELANLGAAITSTKEPASSVPLLRSLPPSNGHHVYPSKHAARVSKPSAPIAGDSSLTGPQRVLLSSLAWWAAMGHPSPTKAQLAGKAGWKPKGSNLRNRLSELHGAGLVEYPRDGEVALTAAGTAAAPSPNTSDTLIESIRRELTGPQLVVFDELLARGQRGKDSLAEALNWKPGGSNLRNRLSELSAMELVEYPTKGSVVLQPWVVA